MKRIFALLLATLLTVSLCACGASQSQTGLDDIITIDDSTVNKEEARAAFDKAAEYLKSFVDLSKMEEHPVDEQDTALYGNWFPLEADATVSLSNDFEVDGSKITIDTTLEKDLEAMDFSIEKAMDTVEPDMSTSVTLGKGTKSMILSLENNYGDQPVPIGDLAVAGFTSGISELNLPFNYNGLTETSTLEDALKIFGVPNDSIRIAVEGTGTEIQFSYFTDATEGDVSVMDHLDLNFAYNAESNTAALTTISRSRDKMPMAEGE